MSSTKNSSNKKQPQPPIVSDILAGLVRAVPADAINDVFLLVGLEDTWIGGQDKSGPLILDATSPDGFRELETVELSPHLNYIVIGTQQDLGLENGVHILSL